MNGLARYCVGLADYQQPKYREARGACDVARDMAINGDFRGALKLLRESRDVELPNFGRIVQDAANDTEWAEGLGRPQDIPFGTDRSALRLRRLSMMRTAITCRASKGDMRDFGITSYHDLPPIWALVPEYCGGDREPPLRFDVEIDDAHPHRSPLRWHFVHRYDRDNHILFQVDWDHQLNERAQALRIYQDLGVMSPEEVRAKMFDER